jgi:hypothetical protein
MIILEYATQPMYDKLRPGTDPTYYVEWRVDSSPTHHGRIQCPEISGTLAEKQEELRRRIVAREGLVDCGPKA